MEFQEIHLGLVRQLLFMLKEVMRVIVQSLAVSREQEPLVHQVVQ
jgi:hypothetical protein